MADFTAGLVIEPLSIFKRVSLRAHRRLPALQVKTIRVMPNPTPSRPLETEANTANFVQYAVSADDGRRF